MSADLAGEVYDCLVDAPNGLTLDDLQRKTAASRDRVRKAIRTARLVLADHDTLFILCEPQGPREPWLYRLVDGAVIPDAEETAWTANRVGDAQSRVKLLSAAMEVATHATSSRTSIGKKARVLDKQLRRLVEDLEEIEVG
jgi:hypothetical protein